LIELVKAILSPRAPGGAQPEPAVDRAPGTGGLEALASGDKLTVRLGPFFADAAPSLRDQLQHRGMNSVVLVDREHRHAMFVSSAPSSVRVDESVTARLVVLLASLGLSG
jgi:hypothetical protein